MAESEKNAYRWNASDYAQHSSAQLQWARELIARLELEGDEHVLDIGCGDGKITAEMASCLEKGRVVGIDSSPDMIDLAMESFPVKRHPNLSFRRMDARSLEFDRDFDVVFSNATLHWVQDHTPVLRGIARSLRSGGKIVLQMGGRGNAAAILAILDEEILKRARWRPFFEGFVFPLGFHGPEEYRPWLAQAGLLADSVSLIPKDMRHRGKDGLAGWIRTTWLPYTDRVPGALKNAFIEEIVNSYLTRRPMDREGFTHVEMVRLQVEARKP